MFSLASTGVAQLLPFWNPLSVLSLALAFVTVLGISIGLSIRQTSIAGLAAYLFFPLNAPPELNSPSEHHKGGYRHSVIVNGKRSPYVAYPMAPNSYSWRLVERHPELCYRELDEAPNDPDYPKKWAEKRGYKFVSKSPGRDDLLAIGPAVKRPLDPRLKHVQSRFFYLPLVSKRMTSKRCILNWSTMTAYTLDFDMMFEIWGRIRSGSGYWWPWRHYVKRWAEHHDPPFEWSDKLPDMTDLLAKRKRKSK